MSDEQQVVEQKPENAELIKVLAVICCLLLPPLGVLVGGGSTTQIIINIILTICFWFPGLIHALYVILTKK
jgi:uncharacterized membrane protein YqaE (UPF0057 family)